MFSNKRLFLACERSVVSVGFLKVETKDEAENRLETDILLVEVPLLLLSIDTRR